MSDKQGLAPCPFCGDCAATIYPRTCNRDTPYNPLDRAFPIVRCGKCLAETPGKDWKGEDTAIAAWNRRAMLQAAPPAPAPMAVPGDDVWEALQRLIENAETLGPASREDALAVARWRARFVSAREAAPVAVQPDAWRMAVDDALVCSGLDCTSDACDPRARVRELLDWTSTGARDPAVSAEAQALIDRGTVAVQPAPVAWLVEWEIMAAREQRGPALAVVRESWGLCRDVVFSQREADLYVPEDKHRNLRVTPLYASPAPVADLVVTDAQISVPRELLQRVSESLGSFCSDHGWAQSDMDTMDSIDAILAAQSGAGTRGEKT